MALFNAADFGGSSGWLPFENRWNEEAIQGGTFAAPGDSRYAAMPDNMINSRLFPGYGTNMPEAMPPNAQLAQGGPQMPAGEPPIPQGGMPPMSLMPPQAATVMPTLGGMHPSAQRMMPQGEVGIGDRIQAAGAGFFNAGSPMQAIGNLIGGLATGQRQDPAGIQAQMFGQAQAASQAQTMQSAAAALEYVRQDPSIPQPMKLAMLRQPALAMKYVAELAKPLKPEFSAVNVNNVGYTFNKNTGQWSQGPNVPADAPLMKPNEISSLRQEAGGLPEVKRLAAALPIYRSMRETHVRNDPAGDIDFVYGVAKIFDPESVVREGEMVIVKRLQNLPEEVRGWLSKVVTGGGQLTPEVRRRILEVARTRVDELQGSATTRLKQYEGITDRYKVNREDVLPQFQDVPSRLPSQAKATQEARDAIKSGVPRAEVIKRLTDMGYSVEGL